MRRKFDEAAKVSKKSGSAHEALARIGKIYRVEQDLRAQTLSAEAFVQNRKEQVLPVLQDFKQWLEAKALQVPPSVLLGKAVGYALKEWEKLLNYLDSPYLTPDTNMIENAIRPFVLGRKNWLFSGAPRGARASATLRYVFTKRSQSAVVMFVLGKRGLRKPVPLTIIIAGAVVLADTFLAR